MALDAGPADGLPTVVVDQQYGVQLATRHLLDLGHRQIAHIAGPPGWSASKRAERVGHKRLWRLTWNQGFASTVIGVQRAAMQR